MRRRFVSDSSTVTNTAAELRDAFDRAYAISLSSDRSEQTENLLAIRLGGDFYALRVSEITGLAKDRKTILLPSQIPELLGVAGIRGGLVSVYSLAALLGYGLNGNSGRWLALCGTEEPVGLAFNDFEGYIKVPFAQVYAQNNVIREHVKDVARAADSVRAIVNISSILDTIKKRCGASRMPKER
jgi:chemotaxis signal transduction protein